MSILAVPVDKGGSLSPKVRLHVPIRFAPRCEDTTSLGGERVAAPETDPEFAAEVTGIQPQQTPAPFRLTSWKNLTWWQALRITSRN